MANWKKYDFYEEERVRISKCLHSAGHIRDYIFDSEAGAVYHHVIYIFRGCVPDISTYDYIDILLLKCWLGLQVTGDWSDPRSGWGQQGPEFLTITVNTTVKMESLLENNLTKRSFFTNNTCKFT